MRRRGLDRIAQVLKHLMGVDHVETAVGRVERVDVAHGDLDVLEPPFSAVGGRLLDHRR